MVLHERCLALLVATVLLAATAGCASDDPDPSSAETPRPAEGEALAEMCKRQEASFEWVFPVRPDYPDVEEKARAAIAGIEEERRAPGLDEPVEEYLDALERFATTLEEGEHRDARSLQKLYTRINQGIYRIHERAEAAGLPSDCSFDLTESEVQELRFSALAARACGAAKGDMEEAPARAAARDGSRVERFIELQGDFGRIYVRLGKRLEKALLPGVAEEAADLARAYRKAGEHRIANMRALQARDDAGARAAAQRFEKHNVQAERLARVLNLPFCEVLMP